MKKYCFILGMFFLLSFKSVTGISGKYDVVMDSKFEQKKESRYTITINENKYTKNYADGDNIEGGIKIVDDKNSKKIYYFKDFIFSQPKKVVNTIPKGKIVMEVEEKNADTLVFRTTYDKQLEVTINTGKLIRQK